MQGRVAPLCGRLKGGVSAMALFPPEFCRPPPTRFTDFAYGSRVIEGL